MDVDEQPALPGARTVPEVDIQDGAGLEWAIRYPSTGAALNSHCVMAMPGYLPPPTAPAQQLGIPARPLHNSLSMPVPRSGPKQVIPTPQFWWADPGKQPSTKVAGKFLINYTQGSNMKLGTGTLAERPCTRQELCKAVVFKLV